MKPHRPARLLFRGDARRLAVRKIIHPARASAHLPFGPVVAPPSYASVTAAADSVCERPLNQPLPNEEATMNTAMTDWYQAARTEFSDIAGVDLKFAPTRFRMEAALSTTASQWAGESATSALWRSLASRSHDVSFLFAKPDLDLSQRRALLSHIKSANKAILLVPKKDREPST